MAKTSKLIDTNALLIFWNGFKDKLHIHSNKSILDAITSSFTTDDRSKLDGIASGANKYTLPTATASVLGGVKSGSNITNTSGVLSLTKDNITAALGYTPPTMNTTYGVATTSANGLMSATDKSKLDGVATGANNYVHPTTNGNKHIPSGGASGQFLKWSAAGTAVWANVDTDISLDNCSTIFNSDGSITQVYDTYTIVTVFNSNGTITETLTKTDGTKQTKTTTFNANGSITEKVT